MRVVLKPTWRGVFEAWSKKWVNQHYWRVTRYFGSKDDALSECCVIFYSTLRRYEGKYENQAHFMALYKTSVFYAWMGFAERDGRLKSITYFDNVPYDGEQAHEGFLLVALGEASKDLQTVLVKIAEAPSADLEKMFPYGSMMKVSDQIRKCCGLKRRKNYMKELKQLLMPER